MRRTRLLPALFFLIGASCAAAAGPAPTPPTETCLSAADSDAGRHACIGESAKACRAAIRNADPVDVAVCVNEETGWWRRQLKTAQELMMAKAEGLDARFSKEINEGAPRLTEDLVALQDAWKAWAEKRCTFEAMLLRGSPNRMIAASECLLQQTADQTLLLERAAGHRR